MPPLTYAATVQALQELSLSNESRLHIYFADEECDPFAVELAGRLGGYVAGKDSDFLILNSAGYLGYIPMDEMLWIGEVTEETLSAPSSKQSDENDGFSQAVKSKRKKRPAQDPKMGKGLIPPTESSGGLTLTFTTCSPSTLASHFNIPVNLLPLLGAVVGNDYTHEATPTTRTIQSRFFQRTTSPVDRIKASATALRATILASQRGLIKSTAGGNPVIELIRGTANTLLANSSVVLGSGEVEDIIDKLVMATLQYAIPKEDGDNDFLWPTKLCPIHSAETCPLGITFARLSGDEEFELEAETNRNAMLYVSAYRDGLLSPNVMDRLNSATHWPFIFLENPNFETVGKLGRSIRLWEYAVLNESVGLPRPETQQEEPAATASATDASQSEAAESEADDEDELVDVIESESESEAESADYLAPLHGALDKLQANTSPDQLSGPRIITEYVRRGTRVSGDNIEVPALTDLYKETSFPEASKLDGTAILSLPVKDRLDLLLRVLRSDSDGVISLPPPDRMHVLALRWLLSVLYSRWNEDQASKDRYQERWTIREAQCFLAAFSSSEDKLSTDNEYPPIEDRNVHLTTQVMHAMETVEHFSQVLLLTGEIPSSARLFSGRLFHNLLSGKRDLKVSDSLWKICEADMGTVFREEQRKRPKKAVASIAPPKKSVKTSGSLFSFLGNSDA